ncbi:MAG: hypothetical protein ABWZ57_13740 [Mesorhizobium sp.]
MKQWLMATVLLMAPLPAGAQDAQDNVMAIPVAASDMGGQMDDEAAADALWEATASDDEEDCDLYLEDEFQAAVDGALFYRAASADAATDSVEAEQ